MATRTTNTQSEALSKLIRTIADIKQYEDADMAFLINLETQIIDYLKRPLQEMAQQADPTLGMMPGGPPVTPSGMPGGPPPQAPSPDSLQRLMSGKA